MPMLLSSGSDPRDFLVGLGGRRLSLDVLFSPTSSGLSASNISQLVGTELWQRFFLSPRYFFFIGAIRCEKRALHYKRQKKTIIVQLLFEK